ncbi:hypothetical protein ACW5WN_03545 [Aeromonas lacus]
MFKQIIPATGWWLRREVSKGEFIDEPLVAWGLYENPEHDGDAAVTGLVTDPDGLGLCEASTGFYIHQSEIDQERAQDPVCNKPLGIRAGAVRKS